MDRTEFANPQDPAPPPGAMPNPYMPPGAAVEAPPEPQSGFPNPFAPAPPIQGESVSPTPTLPTLDPAPPAIDPMPQPPLVATPQPPAAATQMPPATDPAIAGGYHWCPNCFLASSGPGQCISCAQPLQPVTAHLPYGPFHPQVVRPSRGRILVRVLSGLMLPLVGLLGFWLYSIGTPAGSSANAPNDGLVHTASNTGVNFPELGTVKLPGKWIYDSVDQTSIQGSLTKSGGVAHVLITERSGSTIIWLASIVKFPSGVDPCTETPLGNGTPTIAGKPAPSSDYKSVCPGGTIYSRTYSMDDKGATLILKVQSTDSTASFQSIEQAFLKLPGSSAGSVSL